MMIVPQCFSCRHLRLGEGMTCDAFPEGIPTPIMLNQADHREPYPGDHGILFEQADGSPENPFAEAGVPDESEKALLAEVRKLIPQLKAKLADDAR